MPKKKPKAGVPEVRVPIEWHVPDDIISRFATHMVVQTLEHAVKLSFFEAKPEIRLKKTAPVPPIVKADCVASVIIARAKLAAFIEALQKNQARTIELEKDA